MSKSDFLQADQRLQEITSGSIKDVTLSDEMRLKLYGLSKQAKEGDCRMPMPPGSNVILRAKWDSWTSFSGMSSEKAMQEFINLMKNLDVITKASNTSSNNSTPQRLSMNKNPRLSMLSAASFTSKASASSPDSSVRKKGFLYKQRDVFKGWRPRYFVLKGTILDYYIEPSDESPQKSIDISECSIVSLKPTNTENTLYYPFVITHQKSATTYNLAADNKSEAADWIVLLTEVASSSGQVKEPVSTPSEKTVADPNSIGKNVSTPVVENNTVVNYAETIKNIPEKYLKVVESAVANAISASSPSAVWETMFEKNGMVGKRRTNGSQLYVRGDIVVPYNLLEVFSLLMDAEMQNTINPRRDFAETMEIYSPNTFAQYIKFKSIWPTSARDFTNLVHWRQLTDGTVLIVATGENFEHLRPIEEGVIRASLILGSYTLRSTPKGTSIVYINHVDLKGNIPATVINLAGTNQTMLLVAVRKILDSRSKAKRMSSKLNAVVTYKELLVASANATADHEIVESIANSSPNPKNMTSGKRKEPQPRKKNLKESKLNSIALSILFLPVLLYYVIESNNYRIVGFFGGLFVAIRYLLKLQLGYSIPVKNRCEIPSGRLTIRFPVDLGKLLKYVEMKRGKSELEITLTHVTMKVCAMIISEMPNMNGHVFMGEFYPSKSSGVDIGVSQVVSEKETMILKIIDADKKPIEYITNEILTKGGKLRNIENEKNAKGLKSLLQHLNSPFFSHILKTFIGFLECQIGIDIPSLGLNGFPYGVCTIINSPGKDGEVDIDFDYQPSTNSCAPIIVTVGGIGILPTLDSERKISGSPTLNFSISIDSKLGGGSLSEMRRFGSQLQKFLNNPSQLIDRGVVSLSLDDKKNGRKSIFGHNT